MLAAADPDLGIFVYVPLIFALVGAVILTAGFLTLRSQRRFSAGAQRAEGRVTDLRVRRRYEGPGQVGNPMYFPVLAFVLPGGREVQTEARVGTSPAPAQVGDRVTVLYDPADPERAQLEGSGTAGRAVGGCGMALGGTFLIGGLAAFAGALALSH